MQVIHPSSFAPNKSQHTLKPSELASHVLEYWLYDQHKGGKDIFKAPYTETLQDQLFPSIAYAETPPAKTGATAAAPTVPAQFNRLGRLRDILTNTQGAGVVLFDPIGITQELNNFRNDAYTRIGTFLKQTDPAGVSNERKMIIYNKIEELQEGLASGVIAEYDKMLQNSQEAHQRNQAQFAKKMNEALLKKNTDEYAHYKNNWERVSKRETDQIEGLKKQGTLEAKRKWNKNYEIRLDSAEMNSFMEKLKNKKNEAKQAADHRAEDHLTWLTSPELLNAFDTYSRDYVIPNTFSGITSDAYGFATEADLCFFGMEGAGKNDQLLDTWIKSLKIDRQNLFLRSYCHNNQAIEEQVQKAFDGVKSLAAQVNDASDIPAPSMLGVFKSAIDLMKKMDSAFDEWDRDRVTPNPQKAKFIDRKIFFARLGKLTEHLAYDTLSLNYKKKFPNEIDPNTKRAQRRAQEIALGKVNRQANAHASHVAGSLDQVLKDAQKKPKRQ